MKYKIIFLFFYFFILLSCKNKIIQSNNEKKRDTPSKESLYIPKFATKEADYKTKRQNLMLKDSLLHNNIVLKLKNFLYDEDVDISPDYDYENLYLYSSSEKPREKIYFNAKKIKKEYSFYYEKNELICVLEGIYDDDAIFNGDSLFFYNDKIFLWKNTSNQYVTNRVYINGKSKYIMRLDKEIKEIIDLGFTQYIDNYTYKNDSISNFVIGNLRAN